jgi:hypothetical protein
MTLHAGYASTDPFPSTTMPRQQELCMMPGHSDVYLMPRCREVTLMPALQSSKIHGLMTASPY